MMSAGLLSRRSLSITYDPCSRYLAAMKLEMLLASLYIGFSMNLMLGYLYSSASNCSS